MSNVNYNVTSILCMFKIMWKLSVNMGMYVVDFPCEDIRILLFRKCIYIFIASKKCNLFKQKWSVCFCF